MVEERQKGGEAPLRTDKTGLASAW